MKNKKEKQKKLQWHPAFCSALRLELLEDAENLEFTDEFQLTEKPLQIDCTVVKVKRDCKIKNEIGKIFRKHNIFEYKSPMDDSVILYTGTHTQPPCKKYQCSAHPSGIYIQKYCVSGRSSRFHFLFCSPSLLLQPYSQSAKVSP